MHNQVVCNPSGVTPDLRLEQQVCFALYGAARAAQNAYRPLFAELDLTYPQWLVLLVLWEEESATVRELGRRLHLDSGTLSPLLRRMENRGVITRHRDGDDGRSVIVRLTDEGSALRSRAGEVQGCLAAAMDLTPDELATLRDLAFRLVASASPTGDHA